MKGRLIIIASPSGGGKTSVISALMKKYPEMVHSISCTTRPKRPGEVNGEYYHHIEEKSFRDGILAGRFAEWNEVHNNLYGTPKEPIDMWLKEGRDVLLDLDVVGSLRLQSFYRDRAVSIFIIPPTIAELERRLCSRATDSKDVQELRIHNAHAELTYQDKFDHQVINDDLGRAVAKIEEILSLC
jgi:guanylate kinase